MNERSCRGWISRFKTGDSSLENKPREGRPKRFDSEELEDSFIANPAASTREVNETFDVSHRRVLLESKRIQ